MSRDKKKFIFEKVTLKLKHFSQISLIISGLFFCGVHADNISKEIMTDREAFNRLMTLAKKGDPKAQHCLALLYLDENNSKEYKKWVYIAALNDHAYAMEFVGRDYFENKNYERAAYWLKRSAAKMHEELIILRIKYEGNPSGSKAQNEASVLYGKYYEYQIKELSSKKK